jgi:hypothetical protein
MGAPKVTPYYFKATEHFGTNDITICTLVTHDRFPVLARLVKNYKGQLPPSTGTTAQGLTSPKSNYFIYLILTQVQYLLPFISMMMTSVTVF